MAVEALTGDIRGGDELSEILSDLEPLTTELCVQVITSLVDEPNASVTFSLETSSGSLPLSTTGTAMALTPTPPQDGSGISHKEFERILHCVEAYDVTFLIDACVDGSIEP